MFGDPRTDGSYIAMSLDALSWARTSSAAGGLFTANTQVSVDAWIRFNGLPASTAALSQANVFAFGSQGPAVYFQFNGLPIVVSNLDQGELLDDHWHYICATFDGAMLRLYIDGQYNTGVSCMGQVTPNANPVLIGNGVQGLIRRVRIYNIALNAAAVLNNMYGVPAAGTLAADFDFSVNPPLDRGPSAYPVSLQGDAEMIKVSPALAMGNNGFVRPMGEGAINPGGAQVDLYTVQAWIYTSSTLNPRQAIFVNSDLMMDTGIALYLQYDATAQGFRLVSQRGSAANAAQSLSSTATVAASIWTNVATTYDGATLSLYINGVLDSSKTCPPITLYRDTSDLLIGAAIEQGIASGATTLQGYIREVDIWSRALTAAEILAAMATPPDVSSAGLQAAYVFTNSPARNQIDGHPIGLAEGAVLSGQLGPAPTSSGGADSDLAIPPDIGLDPKVMAAIRAGLNFHSLHQTHSDAFDAAVDADLAAFDSPADKALIAAAWADAREKLSKSPTSLPFLLTQHTIDGERLLIVHRPSGSYVAFRGDAAMFDDCTIWKIGLVFIVIAGALDAFTGVGAALTDRAIAFIAQILLNPAIAAQLANGNRMTAGAIFTTLGLMYTVGYLRPLIVLVIDVGFWTFIRVVANLLLVCSGFGSARVVASLVATATTFIAHYLAKPAACTPLPTVGLASIGFNYDPTGAAVDALSIRKNFATSINTPEWVKGAAASPCAYAIAAITGKVPTIQATFTISASGTPSVQIQATGGGILGAIDPTTILFLGRTSVTVTLPLNHQTLAGGGVQRQDVAWTWQYQIGTGPWTTMASSNHRVYVILSPPTAPWRQDANAQQKQLPWTDVLDYACQWAAGATSTDTIQQMITTKVNQGIGLTYDVVQGASVYTNNASTASFLCTQFIAYLKNGTGNGRTVNCTDCATIVTSFSNILGCNLFASTMANTLPPTTRFACNQILAIGTTSWAVPFGFGFSYHEVAWTGAGSYTDALYDACLQYDGGANPWGTGPHTPTLGIKVPFTALAITPPLPIATPFTANSYRERLAANAANGLQICIPQGPWPNASSGRRPAL